MKLLAYVFLTLFATPAFAQNRPFSADMVDSDKNGAKSQRKLYVTAGKMRMDGTSGQPGMIADYGTQTAYILMPKEKMYMQMNMQDGKNPMAASFSLFAPTNPNDPCAQWKKVVTDLTCKKIGTENLDGRSVDKWEGVRAHGEKGFLWFDPKLQFVTKMDSQDHLIEFKNIQEGAQPANLFNVPSDYRKMN
ncbi:MAG: hypothetical protein NVS9B4_14630 [Candidatus Acidiferrum sp.]